MSKPRMYGMKTTYIPNDKADMRNRKKLYQRGGEKTFRQQEIQAKQSEQKRKT